MTSNATYVRWKAGEPRRARVFSPLGPNHPAVSTRCVLCSQFIGIALPVQLFVIGPEPHDEEGRERHAAGRWYTALALIVHAGCLDAETDEQLDTFARQVDKFLRSARRAVDAASPAQTGDHYPCTHAPRV